MVATVKLQPNHYEVLGITPNASEDDIVRAFAREISPLRPHAIGDFAQIIVAYETLRDPIKRRTYDVSLAPKPEPVPSQWPREGWPFVASPRIEAAGRIAVNPFPRPTSQADHWPRSDAPAGGAIVLPSQPEDPRLPDILGKPGFGSHTARDRVPRTGLEEHFLHTEDGSIEWKRPTLLAGALFMGVGLLGAWIGWDAGNDVEPEDPEQAVTLTLPQVEALAPTTSTPPPTISASIEAPSRPEATPERRTSTATATAETMRTPLAPERAREEQQADVIQLEESPPEKIATELVVTQSPPVAATPAKLPLPDSVIARTIRRIGYACRDVASTMPVEGAAAGVFKVTCVSGDSYRASPVRGRYHFRRWGRP